jgi:hypothetical protein
LRDFLSVGVLKVLRENSSPNKQTTRKKNANMTTNRIHAVLRPSNLVLAATAIAALTLAGSAGAQYKAVGDDGIAASPKVRQMLNERKASATPTIAVAPTMTCPKCADMRKEAVSRQPKGAEDLTGTKYVTYVHTCAGCETRLAVVGEGKSKHTVATHKCSADVPNPATCCGSH